MWRMRSSISPPPPRPRRLWSPWTAAILRPRCGKLLDWLTCPQGQIWAIGGDVMGYRFLAVLAFAAGTSIAWAQPVAMPPPHDPNDYPNPYHVDEGWAKLGRTFGGISAVDMDRDGKSVWVFERCGKADDGCARDKTLNPVLKFDA